MKTLFSAIFAFVSLMLVGCVEISVTNTNGTNANEEYDLVTLVGPSSNGEVQLADAAIWIVPPLGISDASAATAIIWTLVHPNAPTKTVIRRTCTELYEPYLWLSDPPNWSEGTALATFHACGTPGEFYSTIELAFDGLDWIGTTATGSATLLPPQ